MRVHGHLHYTISKAELDKARISYSLLNFQAFQENGIAGIVFNYPKHRFNALAKTWLDQGFITSSDKQNLVTDSLASNQKSLRMGRSENSSVTYTIYNYLNVDEEHCLFMYAFRKLSFKLDVIELTSIQRKNLETYLRFRTTEMYNLENEPAVRNLKMQAIRYYAEGDN